MFDPESDYSSSSEGDDDYVPSGEDESCDELEGVVDEDGLEDLEEQKDRKQKARSKGKEDSSSRRRKGWTALKDDGVEEQEPIDDSERWLEDEARKAEAKRKAEEEKKKRADDLWSSFLSDVGTKTKPKPSQPEKESAKNVSASTSDKTESDKKSSTATLPSDSNEEKSIKTLKITQVMDFAGEEVRVTKEVKATSKEAKSFLKEQEKKNDDEVASPSGTQSLIPPPRPAAPSGVKRPGGGLGGVLGHIGKKQKISTLDKSKLDWERFKHSQGIQEELKIHNKGKEGFVEKQRFLQRTDVRQYEIERDMRLAQSKVNR